MKIYEKQSILARDYEADSGTIEDRDGEKEFCISSEMSERLLFFPELELRYILLVV
jgi:hypothetical protein